MYPVQYRGPCCIPADLAQCQCLGVVRRDGELSCVRPWSESVSAAVMVGGGAEVLKAVTASVMTSVMVTASVMTSVTSSSVLVGARSQGDPVVVTASVMTSAAVLVGG